MAGGVVREKIKVAACMCWPSVDPHLNCRAASECDGVKERKAMPVSVFKFQSELNVGID